MGLQDVIIRHFTTVTHERTPRQLEREQWLLPGVRFNRWALLPAALVIQLCCGSLYAWSGLNLPIETAIYGPNGGTDRAIAVNTFYIAVAVFGCTAAILGPWLERRGPLAGALLGASLFFLGNMLAALGVYVSQIAVVYVGYGIIGGAGLGIAYIAPVSPLQKWFPEHRGLAAGFAVCGFGGGSIIAPYTQKLLIGTDYGKVGSTAMNLGVPLTFIILGSCYFVLMILGALVLRMPPPGYEVKGITIETIKGAEAVDAAKRDAEKAEIKSESGLVEIPIAETEEPIKKQSAFAMTLAESLFSAEFGLIYFMFIGSQITGLLIISKIQNIVTTQFDKSSDEGVLINALLGGANLLGRLALPTVSDLIKSRKTIFVVSTMVQAVLLGCIPTTIAIVNYPVFLFEAMTIAFFYGAGFGVIPAFLSDQFGSKNTGPTHGVILTAWALAGVAGGLTFTAVYNTELNAVYYTDAGATKKTYHPASSKLDVYTLNFRWILGFVILGFILATLIPATIRDRRLPKKTGETWRIRIFGRMIRFYGVKPVVVSREEEDKEWEEYLATI